MKKKRKEKKKKDPNVRARGIGKKGNEKMMID